MLARSELFFKWAGYGAAALLCLLVQTALLQRFSVWGVIPFLYPVVAILPAIFESPVSGTRFALLTGVFCDLLLPAPLPCFYTLVFPLAGLCASLLSGSVLFNKVLCLLASSTAAFLLTDLFHCLLLWASGQNAWFSGLEVMVREVCVTLPLSLLALPLFRFVYTRTHVYD